MNVSDNILWTEKYRPRKLEDCILPENVESILKNIISTKNLPHLLIRGAPGIGKTTVAKILVEQIGCDYLFINGSNERNIDTLRNTIQSFATKVSLGSDVGYKVVILDEADYLNPNSFQPALRTFMEQHSDNCRFILTCNFVRKIIPALRSRCSEINWNYHNKEKTKYFSKMGKTVVKICKSENMAIDDTNKILPFVKRYYPDYRKMINALQEMKNRNDKFEFNEDDLTDNVDFLIEAIVKKNFLSARRYLGENSDKETNILFREILKQLEKSPRLDPECIPDIIIAMNTYQVYDTQVADSELNRMAAILNIMNICKWKN